MLWAIAPILSGRHGQLFQNRYKFILCQEDLYLLELTRYIHLNRLRAKGVDVPKLARIVADMFGLEPSQLLSSVRYRIIDDPAFSF